MLIKDNSLILFQGDSITDGLRIRENPGDLGRGYPLFVASYLGSKYPEKNFNFLNRGIAGNKIIDLKNRWHEDCIDLKPDFVSILIGVNDTWKRYQGISVTPTEEYEETYRYLITQIKEKLPKTEIMLCEPFLLYEPKDRLEWREDLDPKIAVVRKLSQEFKTLYLPLDGMFAQASARKDSIYWSSDGVHPTSMGYGLIAESWINAIK